MAYKKHTRREKVAYAKKFSKAQVKSYRAGKRQGFLDGVHAPKKKVNKVVKATNTNYVDLLKDKLRNNKKLTLADQMYLEHNENKFFTADGELKF